MRGLLGGGGASPVPQGWGGTLWDDAHPAAEGQRGPAPWGGEDTNPVSRAHAAGDADRQTGGCLGPCSHLGSVCPEG